MGIGLLLAWHVNTWATIVRYADSKAFRKGGIRYTMTRMVLMHQATYVSLVLKRKRLIDDSS
jgi:hypothetical protein